MKLTGGRVTNLIRTRSGYKYFYPSYLNHTVRVHIKEYQILQNSMDSLDLYLVPGEKFMKSHLDQLQHNLLRFFGNDLSLNIHLADKIERGPHGKYQAVICNI